MTIPPSSPPQDYLLPALLAMDVYHRDVIGGLSSQLTDLTTSIDTTHPLDKDKNEAIGFFAKETIAGIAIWATVSDAVDAKITEQVRAGVFPLRLGAEDWTSGEQVWLLDVVAADRRQATAVLTSFRQVAGDRPVKIHPIVGRMIDPEVLAKLRGAVQASSAPTRRADAE
jgi:RTX toxin acyltransferase family